MFYVNPAQAQTGINIPAETNAETDDTALRTLLDVLKDDSARSSLIEELEAATTKTAPITAVDEPVVEVVSLGRRIALITQEVGQEAVATFSGIWSSLSSGQTVFTGLSGEEFSILLQALPDLLLVILITVSVFLVLRTFAKRFYARLGRRAERAGTVRTISLFLVSNITDLFIVLLAWALGSTLKRSPWRQKRTTSKAKPST